MPAFWVPFSKGEIVALPIIGDVAVRHVVCNLRTLITQQPPAKAGGLVLRTKVRIRVERPVVFSLKYSIQKSSSPLDSSGDPNTL